MKIATWNVERLKHHNSIDKILSAIKKVKADILVLTETDERIKPDYKYSFHTPKLCEAPSDYHLPGRYSNYAAADFYAATENRVSIYTNYHCVRQYETYDKYTSLCVELKTPRGNLLVYGTIIGILGNRDESFKQELLKQVEDYERLSKAGNICICGDFNCSFADDYYFTSFGRDTLTAAFDQNRLSVVTADRPECVDHITISRDCIGDSTVSISEWNLDKSLSDHKGIAGAVSPHIKLVGVGNSGINIINHMIDCGMSGIDFIVISSYAQQLEHAKANNRIYIGEPNPVRLGVTTPEVCRQGVEKSGDVIKKQLSGADVVFVVTGMGGFTATGVAPAVAAYARELGALTIAVATKPFAFEGPMRRRRAAAGIKELRNNVDTIITISNDRLLEAVDKCMFMSEAFCRADEVVWICVQNVTDLLIKSGVANINAEDINRMLSSIDDDKTVTGIGLNAEPVIIAEDIDHTLLENVIREESGAVANAGSSVGPQKMRPNDEHNDNYEEMLMGLPMYYGPWYRGKHQDNSDQDITIPEWMKRGDSSLSDNSASIEAMESRPDGKKVCKYLRGIRIELASANNIPFESEECTFSGPCAGTCEKCDQEAAYLRDELDKIPEKNRKYPQHVLLDWKRALCQEK